MNMNTRASGILLHPTSLPGKYGIGTLGKAAYEFIDFLEQSKQQYWQILPLGPTGYADSPYQCFSAHAGNPNLIDLDLLVEDGLLEASDLDDFPLLGEDSVQFDAVQQARKPLLEKAYQTFTAHARETDKLKFRNFQKEHYAWLNDFAMYTAIKANMNMKPWLMWEQPLRDRDADALKQQQEMLSEEINYHKFVQCLFSQQWGKVKAYAHRKKISIIGDIPLYIALDSADAWANTDIFEFDKSRRPVRVGGVPPDYFSKTGQLWGNPLFRWKEEKEKVYAWWKERISSNLHLYDFIRIDHFRGFAAYWAVPYGEKTAVNGQWIEGPGKDFFDAMEAHFGKLPIIAEDLGVITPDVVELRDGFSLPGMKILEFAFDSAEENEYIPYTYSKNCIVYTGTHDNDTVRGWCNAASEADRKFLLDYVNTSGDDIHWDLIRLAWGSVANTAIVPMQDLLGLGSEARMNIPGTTSGNWIWRMKAIDLTSELAEKLAKITMTYGRVQTIKP